MTAGDSQARLAALQQAGRVLAYGAGGYAATLIPRLLGLGINVTGVIDKFKSGTLACGDRELPIFSLAAARAAFGGSVDVLLTVFGRSLHKEILRDLGAAGFDVARVFAADDLCDDLTVPSDKCRCLEMLGTFMYNDYAFQSCCHCEAGLSPLKLCGHEPDVNFADSVAVAVARLRRYHAEARQGRVPFTCCGCRYLVAAPLPDALALQRVVFGVNRICNLDCLYCEYASGGFFRGSVGGELDNFVALLRELERGQLLTATTTITLAGGESALWPGLPALRDFVRRTPSRPVTVLTNATRHSDELADLIALNPSSRLVCDLDCGTRETYVLVKGFDCFDRVAQNLKRYREVCANIELKYIILPGLNTSDADFAGQIGLLRELRLHKLNVAKEVTQWRRSTFASGDTVFAVGKFAAMLDAADIALTLSAFEPDELRLIERYRQHYRRLLAVRN